MEEQFKKQITNYEATLQKASRQYNLVGYLKLASFILFLVVLYFAFSNGSSYILIIGILLVLLQVYLWIHHHKIRRLVSKAKTMIVINKASIDRLTGDWVNFSDKGEEFIDTDHPYASDLDIVGERSLFQLLNVTNTWHGRQAFANDLLKSNYTINDLLTRQEAIEELSKNIAFSNDVQYLLSEIGASESILKLLDGLKRKQPFIDSKWLRNLLLICPVISFLFIVATVLFRLNNLYAISGLLVLLQLIVWIIGIPTTNGYLTTMSDLPYKLTEYSAILHCLEHKDFTSTKLNQIKSTLVSSTSSASQAVHDLGKIADKISMRYQGILWFILNALLLWDYTCAFMLRDWIEKYSDKSEGWFLALGEFESLLSFSVLSHVCPETSLPNITPDSNVFYATDIGHPLIPNTKRVSNSLVDKNSLLIISGSNMSGKTTFLRTLGINLVLANAGGFVCAKTMTCSLFQLMTSMRISDDLGEGISTFYAELKKIKRILDVAKTNSNLFFLIDEIFRGTNSVDRLYGAKTVIEELNTLNVLGLISTHDLELCQLANAHPRIKNYSFSEHYKNNKILFDYKLKEGKSTSTNGKHLMQMIGLLN